MKIAHISDIHVGLFPTFGSAFFDKRILGAFNYLFRRKLRCKLEYVQAAVEKIILIKPDIVIISGDIVSISTPEEFDKALEVLAPLINSDMQVFYVPGNHDDYVKNTKCQNKLHQVFKILNQNRADYSLNPIITEIKNVKIIQLQQAKPINIFLSCGFSNNKSFEVLNSPKKDDEIRIVIGHFPTRGINKTVLESRRNLRDGEKINKLLQEHKIDLYLCGHIHTPFINRYENSLEISAGSITSHHHINVLEINCVERKIYQHWEILEITNNLNSNILNLGFYPNKNLEDAQFSTSTIKNNSYK